MSTSKFATYFSAKFCQIEPEEIETTQIGLLPNDLMTRLNKITAVSDCLPGQGIKVNVTKQLKDSDNFDFSTHKKVCMCM